MDRRASPIAKVSTTVALGRSSLRSQILTSHRQKQGPNSAASPHLQHLQEVAAWASSAVPALGAFLGSRLASTCESLGCPPPPSPDFTCERCESILHVGTNCSVSVRKRTLKKLSTAAKGVAASNNRVVYSCHYCSFENVKSGTPKAYVKTKPTEVVLRNKLSELSQGLHVSMPERVPQVNKILNNELLFSSNGFSTESPGSTGKKTRRKGWLSLKDLAASSTGLPSSGDRPVLNLKPAKPSHLSQQKLSDSSRAMAIVSQNDSETVASTSSIEGKPSEKASRIKSAGLELEQCNALGITVDADDTGDDARTVAVLEDDSGYFNVENLNTPRLLADEEVKALPSKKRRLTIIDVSAGTTSKQQKRSKSEASRSEVNGLHCEVHVQKGKETRSTRPADVLIDAWETASERKVKSRSKKKPMLTRVGRQWFAVRKTNRKLKWRIV